MLKKILIILIILFLFPMQFSFAKVFNEESFPVKDANGIPDPLTEYKIDGKVVENETNEAKGIFQKLTGEWIKINNWGIGLWQRNLEPYLGKYATQLKENVKQGWEEEKIEYKQDFFKTLGSIWEKIKNSVFHKQGS